MKEKRLLKHENCCMFVEARREENEVKETM
jgi:hypothetical protein